MICEKKDGEGKSLFLVVCSLIIEVFDSKVLNAICVSLNPCNLASICGNFFVVKASISTGYT